MKIIKDREPARGPPNAKKSSTEEKKIHLPAVQRTGGFLISAGTTYSLGGSQYHRREEIYYRVRNGNGCGLFTMSTRKFH